MTAKRFTLNSVLNFDYDICDYGESIGSFKDICELLNELHEENQSLKSKHMEMLDFIEEKGTVTVNDIKEWWNTTR